MDDKFYYTKSLRHIFSRLVRMGEGFTGTVGIGVLGATAAFLGAQNVNFKIPDHQTTPQTVETLASFRHNLTDLSRTYKHLQAIDNALETSNSAYGDLKTLQQQNYREHTVFEEKAVTLLQSILLNPHLSESQAKALMKDFEEKITSPGDIDPVLDITDFGYLREARNSATRQSDKRDLILITIYEDIQKQNAPRKYASTLWPLVAFIFATVCSLPLTQSARIEKWAKEKPEKPKRFKH